MCLPAERMALEGDCKFEAPVRSYDVHVYFVQTDEVGVAEARALHAQIVESFPELGVHKFWAAPIGPHAIGNFEINLKTPSHLAKFVPWIQVNRRGFSVLVHPNTGYPIQDHTVNAMWVGEKQVLNVSMLEEYTETYGWF